MIPESFVQDLLARVDIVDVVGRYVQLRKGGVNLLGLCPFHNEKSPSFTVSPTKQFYHCFGCGAHGSAIGFLMEHTGANFPEAVRTLAGSVGLAVPEEQRGPRQQAEAARKKEEVNLHTQVLEKAQAHYLKDLRASSEAIAYLKQRGLTGQITAHFGLGWAGGDRHGLSKVFENYADPTLVEAGLVIESEDGRRYDRFRERIMFPIRNARGALVGFGGRVIGRGEPKYLNSPETPVFSKGQELYGLWEARQAIREAGVVIVVEGYMDVVGLAQLGIANAVASLGTATTPDHIKKLLRVSDKIVFSFDGDAAGRKASWRALQACLPMLRDDISIRFLFLPTEPAKHDPDSYVREFGADAFREQLAQSPALSRFLLDELAARHDLGEAEGRAACVYEAAPLIGLIPPCALRTQIERELAKLVLLTPEELSQAFEARQARAAPMPMSRAAASVGMPSSAAHAPRQGAKSMPPYMANQGGEGGLEPYPSRTPRRAPAYAGRRTMPSLARHLLRLLLACPQLVDAMGDQQFEAIAHDPQLTLVSELAALISSTGARHLGALIEAADPESDLALAIQRLQGEVLALDNQDQALDAQAEWDGALRRIEADTVKAELDALARDGLETDGAKHRYQTLLARLQSLKQAGTH